MRSLLDLRIPWKALAAALLVVSALPVDAKPARKKPTATKTKKATAKPAEPPTAEPPSKEQATAEKSAAEQPVAEKAAAEPPAPAAEPPAAKPAASQAVAARPSSSAAPAAARPVPTRSAPVQPAPMAASAPVQARGIPPAPTKLRIGVGLDLFTENSRMNGEQAINTSRRDESFDYSSGSFMSATLSMSVPAPIGSDRARIGGGLRLFGNYSRSGDVPFGFGLLNQAFITGEYGLPVGNQFEALFGVRGGLSLLFPGREFSAEINRLQDQGVDVWSVPRIGWLAGLSLGTRRQMTEHILLRADLAAQYEKLFLFATSQDIDGLQFNKDWTASGLRMGLT
ncbi:MAG TPA: hypothetical protein VF815_09680, partial [Myxococcaceae bacterium]